MQAAPETLRPFVEMACDAIHREYPVASIAVLRGPEELKLPRDLTPAFYGSFDWHSAVHTHWTLVRAVRMSPGADWVTRATVALGRTLTADALAREHAFMLPRPGFERPYGLAWLLMLASEVRALVPLRAEAAAWRDALAPLETLAADRLVSWAGRLPYPVRSGEHSQSAFALGLALDWAREAGAHDAHEQLASAVLRLHRDDANAPVAYEPSAQDFLSPLLGAADALRRVMPRPEFANWLHSYLPPMTDEALARWLTPVTPPDRTDGKFAHLDGLNLSRAWMLEGIVSALPEGHECYSVLERAAYLHAQAGLTATRESTHWMGTHWLASFATYLVTRRGIAPEPA
jgi:hypothetical protein